MYSVQCIHVHYKIGMHMWSWGVVNKGFTMTYMYACTYMYMFHFPGKGLKFRVVYYRSNMHVHVHTCI